MGSTQVNFVAINLCNLILSISLEQLNTLGTKAHKYNTMLTCKNNKFKNYTNMQYNANIIKIWYIK